MEKIIEKSAIPYREGVEFSLLRRDIAVGGQMISIQGIYSQYTDIYLPLYGAHQASNAAVALATAEAFVGMALDEEVVRNAFANVKSPGRLEVLHRDPTVIVDAAHNPHGARALANTLQTEFDFESIFCVLAILGDKDVIGVLKELEPVVDRLVVSQSNSPRAFADRVYKEANLINAITYASEQVTLLNQVSEGVSAVVITGSVVTAGEARTKLKKIGRAEE